MVLGMRVQFLPLARLDAIWGSSSAGRALACRASSRGFESRLSRSLLFWYFFAKWGIAKLVKAVDFGSAMQRFEPFYPSGPFILILMPSNTLQSLLDRQDYSTLFTVVVASLSLSAIILALSLLLAIRTPDPEKSSAYECGFEPFEDARNRFDIRFSIVAILFLIFDVEVAYLFP